MIARRVVKVGGSLISRPGFPSQLRALLDRLGGPAQNNLIFGGGEVVEALRRLDAIHQLDPVAMHWRCVRALDLVYDVACEWFGDFERVDRVDVLSDHVGSTRSGNFLIKVECFYNEMFNGDDQPASLPWNWSTTSDSIAAWLARRLEIEHLAILKSCEIPLQWTPASLSKAGIVDDAFSLAAEGLTVSLHHFA